MRASIVFGLVAGLVGTASAVPEGCQTSITGSFELTSIPFGTGLTKRATVCGGDSTLVLSLGQSVLLDAKGRTGYISSSRQLQFDNPPQFGFETADGFSLCDNGIIALGNSTMFWACKSGPFENIYSTNVAPQCKPVHLGAIACGDNAATIPAPVGASFVTAVIPAISNGVATTITTAVPIPLCQINDGQVQAHLTPCAEIQIGTVTIGVPSSATPEPTVTAPPAASDPGIPTSPDTPVDPAPPKSGAGMRDGVTMTTILLISGMVAAFVSQV